MSWLVIAGVFVAAHAVMIAAVWAEHTRARRLYRAKVGLTLDELIDRLPPALRERRYTRFVIRAREQLEVAMIYQVEYHYRGNPPNVGVVFDAKTGTLVEVLERGIALVAK